VLVNLQLGGVAGHHVRLFVNNATNAQLMLQRFADALGALVSAFTPRTLGLMGTWTF
jgi:hypothetical protein